MSPGPLIALVAYDGVVADECEAFRSVLGLLTEARVITVGARTGEFVGPGGVQHVSETFVGIDRVDALVVPGGLGCERAANNPALQSFLHRMDRSARFIVASSSGTVLLAAAGVLHGEAAATHWLAGDLLRRYGSERDTRRLVVTERLITCTGHITAVSAAFELVERLEGPEAVARIKATLLTRGQEHIDAVRRRRSWGRWRVRRPNVAPDAPPSATSAGQPVQLPDAEWRRAPTSSGAERPPVTPVSVLVELIDDAELAGQLRRSRHRHRGGR